MHTYMHTQINKYNKKLRNKWLERWLSAFAALVENQGSIARSHMVDHNHGNSSPTGSDTLFWSLGALHAQDAYTYLQIKHPYTQNKYKSLTKAFLKIRVRLLVMLVKGGCLY